MARDLVLPLSFSFREAVRLFVLLGVLAFFLREKNDIEGLVSGGKLAEVAEIFAFNLR